MRLKKDAVLLNQCSRRRKGKRGKTEPVYSDGVYSMRWPNAAVERLCIRIPAMTATAPRQGKDQSARLMNDEAQTRLHPLRSNHRRSTYEPAEVTRCQHIATTPRHHGSGHEPARIEEVDIIFLLEFSPSDAPDFCCFKRTVCHIHES